MLARETLRALAREDAREPVLEIVHARAGNARDGPIALSLTIEQAQWSLDADGDRRALEAARHFAMHGIDTLIADEQGEAACALALGQSLP